MAEQKTHLLKVREPFWTALVSGQKTFEIRKNDRDFRMGDQLVLARYPQIATHTPMDTVAMLVRVTYVLTHEGFPEGVMPGYCVMGIDKIYSVWTLDFGVKTIDQFKAQIESWEVESDG